MNELMHLLQRKSSLLVHFSACPKMGDGQYPDDLRQAIANYETYELTCCTVSMNDDRNNTPGSIGIILSASKVDDVLIANASDAGTHRYGAGTEGKGRCTGVDQCERAIVDRPANKYNEWIVRRYAVHGIFLLAPMQIERTFRYKDMDAYLPAIMRGVAEPDAVMSAPAPLEIADAFRDFPDHAFYTIQGGRFCELLSNTQIKPSSFEQIYATGF